MSRKIIATVLTGTLITMSVLAIVLIGAVHHSNVHSCPFTTGASECPAMENSFAGILHHLSELENRTTALIPNTVFHAASITLFTLFVTVLIVTSIANFRELTRSRRRRRTVESPPRSLARLLEWLSMRRTEVYATA